MIKKPTQNFPTFIKAKNLLPKNSIPPFLPIFLALFGKKAREFLGPFLKNNFFGKVTWGALQKKERVTFQLLRSQPNKLPQRVKFKKGSGPGQAPPGAKNYFFAPKKKKTHCFFIFLLLLKFQKKFSGGPF